MSRSSTTGRTVLAVNLSAFLDSCLLYPALFSKRIAFMQANLDNRSMVLENKQPAENVNLIAFRVSDEVIRKLRIKAAEAKKSSVPKLLRSLIDDLISDEAAKQ